jgi:hypothetical protein
MALSYAGDEIGDGFAFCSFGSLDRGNLDDAEEVAVGIFQDDKVIARLVSPWIAGSAEIDEAFHLGLFVVGVEVEMQATALA